MLLNPSYGQGFARDAAQSKFPELWYHVAGLWLPSLGPSGLTLFDWSGNKKDGILTDMDAATDWVVSERGYCLDYDGTADRTAVGTLDPFADANAISIVAWIAPGFVPTVPTINPYILGKSTPNVFFRNATNTFRFALTTSATVTVESAGIAWLIDTWHLLACTYDGTVMSIYWDGDLINTSAQTGSVAGNANAFFLGSDISSTFTWLGKIGDVMIYTRSLTHSEIRGIFSGAHPLILEDANIGNAPFVHDEFYRTLLQGDRL